MKHRIKNLVKRIPVLKKKIYAYQLSKKFKVEIELLNNKSKVDSSVPSIIHFSVNKAATQHVKGVLRKISTENGLLPVSIHDYAFVSKMPFLDHLAYEQMEEYKHIFKETGYLYSVFGGMIENIDNFNKYRVVLSIRDPRDILVSNYYSVAYSHPIPPVESNKRKEFLERRAWAKEVGIDEFVLKESNRVYSIFDRYKSSLCKYHNVGIVKYEDMIHNYQEWLMDLAKKTGMKISSSLEEALIKQNRNKKPKNEDKLSHNRKGIAGDYKEKLKEETIEKLNNKFRIVFLYFNYNT